MGMTSTPSFVEVVNGWPSINVGALRHPVTIQAQGQTSPPTYDAAGQVTQWATFTTGMAAIDSIRGTDVIKSGLTTTQLFLTVTMWYQPGVLPNMRIITENGSQYVIQSINNVLEMGVVMILNCLGLGANV